MIAATDRALSELRQRLADSDPPRRAVRVVIEGFG
jgi:hypothetical protein